MPEALKKHWPEYLMEAAELGIFMISACGFGVLLEHPASPAHQVIANPFVRRILMGLAMGLTAIAIIYSPWGKQSGAHFNPAVTLTFFRLGKVGRYDAIFYIIAQFAGGVAGVLISTVVWGNLLAAPSVNYVVTVPGPAGPNVAFLAEVVITFILMTVILRASNHQRLARFTGLFGGALVALYITFEAPLSGMSMNPARTFGSALPAQHWMALWVYFTAPLIGMLAAAQVYLKTKSAQAGGCAKWHHQNRKRCIFCGKPEGVIG
jgi:aquaporin Z